MKKFLKKLSCLLLLLVILWSCWLYCCIDNAKSANVLIETKICDIFGEGYVVGSGVVVSPNGYIVTAKHVIKDSVEIRITLADGSAYFPVSIYEDEDSDLALLKIDAAKIDFVAIQSSDNLSYLDFVYGIGNAEGIFDADLSLGYIHKNKFKRMYFKDNDLLFMRMKVYQGCSGGGVYRYDKLIGIMTNGYGGYSFAFSSNEIIKFLQEIGIAI